MILVVDNYDSFVHNLARYVRRAGAETTIIRNDAARAEDLAALRPDGVVLSPGPKSPAEAGACLDLLKILPRSTPVLGVCLGHQCLVEAFGGWTRRALRPLHGEAAEILHDGAGLFADLPSPMTAGRYHSLISVLPESSELYPAAFSAEGEIMAVRHKTAPWHGVQFHPESLLTEHGAAMVAAFVGLCAR